MHSLACIGFALALVPVSFCQTKGDLHAGDPSAFTITIDQPAYTNEPVWLRVLNGPIQNVRYPFYPAIGFFGCNKLEVRRDGVLLNRRTIPIAGMAWSSPACGSSAPAGSPQGRLPFHVLYPLTQPGTYSVRWTIEDLDFTAGSHDRFRSIGESQWLTFTVLAETPGQHENWVESVLANPPKDPGQIAGDFLPSLIADAPDPRALYVFLNYLYADNQIVAAEASSALELFPQSEVMHAVVEAIEEHGPSDQLAYYASYHKGWTLADEGKAVHAAADYLIPPEKSRETAVHQPYAPTSSSAAIKLLRFIFYVPNHAWPSDGNLNAWADAQVLRASPNIMAHGSIIAVQELAEYLGSTQPSVEAHSLLLRIADRDDNAGKQAKICLDWHRPS